jgi:hypothetical protein
MNRAEIRRLEREKIKDKTHTYNLTKAQLDTLVRERVQSELNDIKAKIKKEATEDAVNTAMVLMLTLPLKVLMDDYWTGEQLEQIPEFTDKVIEYYEKWQNGELDIDKLREDLWNYAGVRLEGEE